jgi:ABC-type lipoprotein export system ATPase subunit
VFALRQWTGLCRNSRPPSAKWAILVARPPVLRPPAPAWAYPGSVGSPLVRARGLSKTYGTGHGAVRVLDGADLEVPRGAFVAVVGRSGSGKSTLLHLLGGLDRADGGTIELDGIRLDRLDERGLTAVRRRQVGFVFQAFHLLPELTGVENVLLPARLARDGFEAAPRASELLERLELTDVARRLPTELSGGEQQRLAVARALINDPPLVLADEPTGNLDDESGAAVLQLLRRVSDAGHAVVLVTHDRAATALADVVFRLHAGRLTA